MLFAAEPFSEDVCNLISSGSVHKSDLFAFNLLSQKMVSNFNMLCLIMEFGVMGDGDGGLIVYVERSC
jgi:hypothetical protein